MAKQCFRIWCCNRTWFKLIFMCTLFLFPCLLSCAHAEGWSFWELPGYAKYKAGSSPFSCFIGQEWEARNSDFVRKWTFSVYINKWYLLSMSVKFTFLPGHIVLMARKYTFSGCIRSLGNVSVLWGGKLHLLGQWGDNQIPAYLLQSAANYCPTA